MIAAANPIDHFRLQLFKRAGLVAGILLLEWVPLGIRIRTGLHLRYLVLPFIALLVLSGYRRVWSGLQQARGELASRRFNPTWFGAHILTLLIFFLIQKPDLDSPLIPLRSILADCLYIPAVWCLFSAFFPPRILLGAIGNARYAWLHGFAGCALSQWLLGHLWSLWTQSASSESGNWFTRLTFQSVAAILRIFLPAVDSDIRLFRIGARHFHVRIADACSGVEGLGSVLVLSLAWLWFFRSEVRFPRSFLLVPTALFTMWALNVLRISGLILIGNAGAREVAVGGFHSVAGWIALNATMLAFCGALVRIPWFLKDRTGTHPMARHPDRTAAWLMPFLAILATSFLTRATSGGFDRLYPLRLVAAAAVLWSFRTKYRNFEGSFRWISLAVGTAVFAVWLVLAHSGGHLENATLAAGLASLSPTARFLWLASRVAAAVTTVPIAEELAFRGYVARRIMAVDFETVELRNLSWLAIAGSSILFGMMHGDQWLAGIVAGFAYAAVARGKGGLSAAITAHATTNALLAVWVLSRGDWGLW